MFEGEASVARHVLEEKLREYDWYLSMNEADAAVWTNEVIVLRIPKRNTFVRDEAVAFATTAKQNPRI